MERPHHRYRPVERIRELAGRAFSLLRRRDEQALEPYAFLSWAGEDISGELAGCEKKLKRSLLICTAGCAVLFALAALFGTSSGELRDLLQRPAYGQQDETVLLHLELTSDEASWAQDVEVEIPARELTRREAEELFDRCEEWLRTQILGCGQDTLRVTGDLLLPSVFEGGPAEISWASSDPARIAEDGSADLVGASEGQAVELTAGITAGEFSRLLRFTALLAPSGADLSSSLQMESEALLRSLPDAVTETEQVLPDRSPFGASADWSLPGEGLPWEVIALLLLGVTGLVFSRTDALKKRLRREKSAFEREIPGMSLQMILLLDAGLTVEGAFQRLIRENRDSDNPLYRAFASLDEESRATNLPFVNALYVYARQSGIRDLIRFASLALDCSGMGSELAEKLDRERQQLWKGGVNQAKARAREAETKLCLPLMILLLVLVVIAVAPALLEL